ncbi:uncharacterized protein BO80DRAFT_407256 [Aspergillus ibericus CBS 121593]|uniref:Uncharacterized protein n=1 Tax=Aspergillus ibericus CBS 121593 TaxID=1448316 RepID=A0A395GZ14_9EURO|nr:hypothetical protein BO80DRAFT_407256 [Aspergillus ibericus CBS 121593]RAL00862.1 hypothetical protein BO80DRAFT_407256 [Aspergillus ibericus CBS 121593]
MHFHESREHRALRTALRGLEKQFNGFGTAQFDYSGLQTHMVKVLSMDLDEPNNMPKFFTACLASLLLDPDQKYDQKKRSAYLEFNSTSEIHRRPIDCARNTIAYLASYVLSNEIGTETETYATSWFNISLGDRPFENLDEYSYPEFGVTKAIEVKDRSYPHVKAMIYNNLDGTDGQLLRGEIIMVLRIIHAQARRARLLEHTIIPVLLFSFMGPQHARIIEAYFDGSSLVMRPTQLFDLRNKDQALIKSFGQWWLGGLTGQTKVPVHLRS